jgi:hypothetical protein
LRSPSGAIEVSTHTRSEVIFPIDGMRGSVVEAGYALPDARLFLWMASVWPTTVVVFGWASKYNIVVRWPIQIQWEVKSGEKVRTLQHEIRAGIRDKIR